MQHRIAVIVGATLMGALLAGSILARAHRIALRNKRTI